MLRAVAARTATGSVFMGFFSSLYMIFAVRELRLSAVVIGAVISAGGAASLLGALATERLVRRWGFGPTLIGSAMLPALGSLLLPIAHGPPALCAAFLVAAQLCDVAWPVYDVNELSLRQAITPNHLLGRVNAAMHLLFRGLLLLGALAGGAIAQAIGMRATLLAGALGFLLSGVWLVCSPIRHLRELPKAVAATEGR